MRHSRLVNLLEIGLRVPVPSPHPRWNEGEAPSLSIYQGGGEGTASRGLLKDPCDIWIGLLRIPLNNICVSRLFEISEGA